MSTAKADTGKIIDGPYTIHANDINLLSLASDDADGSKGSNFLLDAQGNGADKKDGHLWLKASGTACMLCDTACVAIQTKTKQEILIECDDTGEITIHQGKLLTDPTIVLKPEGITLSVGPDAMASKIEITKDGITLSCGPMAKIQMTQQGIKLVVADMNSVELKPAEVDVQGLSVKVNGQIETDIQGGVQTKVSAGAMLKEQGAITMIG